MVTAILCIFCLMTGGAIGFVTAAVLANCKKADEERRRYGKASEYKLNWRHQSRARLIVVGICLTGVSCFLAIHLIRRGMPPTIVHRERASFDCLCHSPA